jgi:hypothetical protein
MAVKDYPSGSSGFSSADFDEPSYLGLNPDVKSAKLEGRLHYAIWGRREGQRYN